MRDKLRDLIWKRCEMDENYTNEIMEAIEKIMVTIEFHEHHLKENKEYYEKNYIPLTEVARLTTLSYENGKKDTLDDAEAELKASGLEVLDRTRIIGELSKEIQGLEAELKAVKEEVEELEIWNAKYR